MSSLGDFESSSDNGSLSHKDSHERGFKKFRSPFIYSIGLHFLVLSACYLYFEHFKTSESSKTNNSFLLPDYEKPNPNSIPLRILNESEFREIVDTKLVEKSLSPQDKAKYWASQTQRVNKETRANTFGSPHARSSKESGQSKNIPPPKPSPTLDKSSLFRITEATPHQTPNKSSLDQDGLDLPKGTMDRLDRNISIGADTLLNTDEYIYASFFNRLKQEIGPRWEPKVQQFFRSTLTLHDGTYSTRYAFYLDDEGNLLEIEALEASGSGTLDSIAAQAIREVARFPNPPSMLKEGSRHRIVFGFVANYSRNRFLPKYEPDRRYAR